MIQILAKNFLCLNIEEKCVIRAIKFTYFEPKNASKTYGFRPKCGKHKEHSLTMAMLGT